jgi:hypothetical protein
MLKTVCTYYIIMLLSTDIHRINSNKRARKSRECNIKLQK